jgi:hypothetical protein
LVKEGTPTRPQHRASRCAERWDKIGRREDHTINIRIAIIVILFLFFSNAYAESINDAFIRLRSLPESVRKVEFNKFNNNSKIELFFIANSRRPPSGILIDAIAQQNIEFQLMLRDEVYKRGETPEVLAFLTIIHIKKVNKSITIKEIEMMKLSNICSLAPQSQYCPDLLSKVR